MKNRILLALLLSVGSLFTGCQTISENKLFKKEDEERVFETPSKIVAIWTNSVFSDTGEKPVRGLGGRLYFYDKNHQPIQVDGKLSVFLYDDTNAGDRKKQEASKTVHFTPEEVATKFTPSDFGASYSFWVPWDQVGGKKTQLAVIPVFTARTGEMIVGDQARHLLPGKDPIKFIDSQEAKGDSGVRQVSYEEVDNNEDSESRIRTSTIKLSPALQERLRQGWPVTRTEKKEVRTKVERNEKTNREPLSIQLKKKRAAEEELKQQHLSESQSSTTDSATEKPKGSSELELLQAQALQYAQLKNAPARNPLGRVMSKFRR